MPARNRSGFFISIFIFLAFLLNACGSSPPKTSADLRVRFKGDAQIEVGGPYVGVEMHHGAPLLNRISFFYPVANSVDLSTDYWQRHRSRIMALAVKIGTQPVEWLGQQPLEFQLTPYSVQFHQVDADKALKITYEFCLNQPVLIGTFELTNRGSSAREFTFFTHLEGSLRTSHSYKLKDQPKAILDGKKSAIYFNYDGEETGGAQLFVANAGEPAVAASFTVDVGSEFSLWAPFKNAVPFEEIINRENRARPVARFIYKKKLAPGETIRVVQILGACKKNEALEIVSSLRKNYAEEVRAYENDVLKRVYQQGKITTGNAALDHSAAWARAILAANAHYLDGEIVPMPCPAEYNFFFTHDALVTDLAAVIFDSARVKKDLLYIAEHAAPDSAIAHAYYWKDTQFVMEFAGKDNWNHFWFVLVSASYLRHTNDTATLETLFPFLKKSLQQIRENIQDSLSWAAHPDWWDIGKNRGPRAYMTILAIRAIQDYVFISTTLNIYHLSLLELTQLTEKMRERLEQQLWDAEENYLTSYNENLKKDEHFYSGSLLAAHFNAINEWKTRALLQTAEKKLLDKNIGIYNAFPMDFHQRKDEYRFNGNEAGDEYFYFNGGVWPQGNAWYALGLIAAGKKEAAFHFIQKCMTLQGVMNSPNGQPAMYEYRHSNQSDASVYGKIDKPQFLWAAGWYLYSVYHLLGVRENAWNLTFEPYLIPGQSRSNFEILAGGKKLTVTVSGAGKTIQFIKFNGQPESSTVLPQVFASAQNVQIELGQPQRPFLAATTSILQFCRYHDKNRRLTLQLAAFPGYKNQTTIVSPFKPEAILLNDQKYHQQQNVKSDHGIYELNLLFYHQTTADTLIIQF